jgi:glucose/arabinose dehydrogenase
MLFLVALSLVPAGCSGTANASQAAAASALPSNLDPRLSLVKGFHGNTIASVDGARELATLPDGDLLVGTMGNDIDIVQHADAPDAAGAPGVFVTLPDGAAEGVTYAPDGNIYASTNRTIYKIPYAPGATTGTATAIAHVRIGPVAPHSDGDVHRSTSVVATKTALYAGVGSSCNACVEADPTRATVQRMTPDGGDMRTLATRVRNAIALAINPATGSLWIAGAGQDGLAYGHPYEFMDSPTRHGESKVDYGWPQCEENHHAYNTLHANPSPDCADTIEPAIEFPAYATLIGLTFYPENEHGKDAFPAAYRGGAFVTSHGSWHCCPATAPRVYFVAMHGDTPATPVNWNDPRAQSTSFLSGFGTSASSSYIGRPTGIAVGPQGSLFVADDQNGAIYRIRPDGD